MKKIAGRKLKVGILMGGRSAEHEVSLASAKNIINALDRKKYEIVVIGIDKQGRWLLHESAQFLLNAKNPRLAKLNQAGREVALVSHRPMAQIISLGERKAEGSLDVIFPVLHGTYGEDGTVQGFLKLADVPYVGPDVLGSALGIDKDAQKRLLHEAGISVARFKVIKRHEYDEKRVGHIVDTLGFPLFVKPANLGSSVGISKAKNQRELFKAIKEAFNYDNKILIEEFIKGREIECSVLGNEKPIASIPGEVIPQHEFYSYEAKYIDENGAILKIPAKLPKSLSKKIQQLAVKAFQTLCCEGMARVDMFLSERGKIYLNEINTIPGFTNISMYPKLWEASGISQVKLVDTLINLAIERYARDKKLKTSYKA